MFDIKEQDVLGQTNKLLYNIWLELKHVNEKAITIPVINIPSVFDVQTVPLQSTTITNVSGGYKTLEGLTKPALKCKVCGTEHENKGSLMACYRKHKKEGENK